MQRYSAGAQDVQPALCCQVDYDPALLEVIPAEVLERDRKGRIQGLALDLDALGGWLAAHATAGARGLGGRDGVQLCAQPRRP